MTTKRKRRLTLGRRAGMPESPPGAAAAVEVDVREGAPGAQDITVFAYTEEALEERSAVPSEEIAGLLDRPGTVWIDVNGLAAAREIERICELYGVHPLILEDILSASQRPKLEELEGYLAVSLKMFYFLPGEEEVVTEQVSLVLGRGYVLSFQEKPGPDVFGPVRAALQSKRSRLRRVGADHLAYALVDAVVDNYYVVLERLGERIEALEDEVLGAPTNETLARLHALRSDIIFLRKAVWPLREAIDRLRNADEELVLPATAPYLRDLHDHTVQVLEQIEALRDVVTGLLELYLSSVSNRLNEVLKRLTIITTIFMPLSVIAGVGGMSEWSMMTGPEHWPWTYPLFCLGLAAVGALTFAFLRWKRWT